METLEQLLNLPDDELHGYARRAADNLESCTYRLGMALVAAERCKLPARFGYGCVIQYAVSRVGLARQKAAELMRACRALADLPLLREAFRTGRLRWGKVRDLTRVATVDSESEWLSYALSHTTDEVQKAVTISPRAFRKQRDKENEPELDLEGACGSGSERSEEGGPDRQPIGTERPGRSPLALGPGRDAGGVTPLIEFSAPLDSPEPAPIPASPAPKVRLTFELTAEEFARYERVEDRVRQQLGRRISREQVLMKLVEAKIAVTSSEAKVRLPVVVRVDGASGLGWYETRRGLLPAPASEVERALVTAAEVLVLSDPSRPDASPPEEPPGARPSASPGETYLGSVAPSRPAKRRRIPRRRLRQLIIRAGGKCELCGRGGPLHVHHRVPVSEGGSNDLKNLSLRCVECHEVGHAEDFVLGGRWYAAREGRRERKGRFRESLRQ